MQKIDGIDEQQLNKLMSFVNEGKDNRIETLKSHGEELGQFVETGKNNRISTLKKTMDQANLVSIVLLVISVIITLSISTALIKAIARSVKQLYQRTGKCCRRGFQRKSYNRSNSAVDRGCTWKFLKEACRR